MLLIKTVKIVPGLPSILKRRANIAPDEGTKDRQATHVRKADRIKSVQACASILLAVYGGALLVVPCSHLESPAESNF